MSLEKIAEIKEQSDRLRLYPLPIHRHYYGYKESPRHYRPVYVHENVTLSQTPNWKQRYLVWLR